MRPHPFITGLASAAALSVAALAQQPDAPGNQERRFVKIAPNDQIPTVRAIVPIDGANVFFLNHRGQIAVAKFSPGLSQIGWEPYSEVKLNALPSLALGPNYSLVTASPMELTQGFDTDSQIGLDFFQSLCRDWPERRSGTSITAGPVADPHGRILFALSPHALRPGDPAKARIMAWNPKTRKLIAVTESELPVESFAVHPDGLLAARLSMPDYADGYFLSLTDLPVPSAEHPDVVPSPMPFTLPSMILPAEMTQKDAPVAPVFLAGDGRELRLVLTCPESKRLIEVAPERKGGLWQGSILLRGTTPKPIRALAEMSPGALLGGGDEGFAPLLDDPAVFRIQRLALVSDGILLEFSQPVDRYEAVKAENFSVKTIALGGGETILPVEPVVESDGRTLVLHAKSIPAGSVLRVICQNLPSETGTALLSTSAFYSVHSD